MKTIVISNNKDFNGGYSGRLIYNSANNYFKLTISRLFGNNNTTNTIKFFEINFYINDQIYQVFSIRVFDDNINVNNRFFIFLMLIKNEINNKKEKFTFSMVFNECMKYISYLDDYCTLDIINLISSISYKEGFSTGKLEKENQIKKALGLY